MTHEERARSCIYVAKSGISFAGIDERVLIPNIVEALRAVEREAYERAAKLCEQYRHDANTFGAVPTDPMLAMSVAAREISSAIRALGKESVS
jgi:hypothetical protein